MPSDEQHEELLRTIAALTERVYRLEQQTRRGERAQPGPQEIPRIGTGAPPTHSRFFDKARLRNQTTEDLESKIGGHWLNRVGILAVLIGASYFLKYAFDNEWVGAAGRVVIGLAAGLAVILGSEVVRRGGYAIFSYSLKAIGIGVLYLSLWASSQLYHLVPNPLAFLAMMTVTAATVAMALWQDAEVIAAFATLGAFITPVVLSTGDNNAAGLFTCITTLDVGALVLLRYRPWIRVLVGSYIGTLILYFTWHSNFYTPDQFTTALISVSAIFGAFALVPFVARRDPESRTLLVIALANSATYFFAVWELFKHAAATRESAATAVVLGGLYFVAARLLANRAPAALAQVHAAIGAAFLVVAVPIGLDRHWITLGWFVEAAALIEVSRRTGNETLRLLAGIALGLGVCRLLMTDRFEVARLLLNERMILSVVGVGVLAFVARRWAEAVPFLIVTINVVALVALNREITDALSGIVRDFAYSALWMSYGAGLMLVGFWQKSRFLRWQALILIAVTIGKVFLYDISSLDRGYRILSLIALGLILLVTSFLYQRNWFKLEER